MALELFKDSADEFVKYEGMYNFDDKGNKMSWLGFRTIDSRYCGNYVNTMTVSGVGTKPEYRRSGSVRTMFNKLFEMAPERGWTVGLLHPFSFAYYRKFGYEKVADHLVLEFPIEALSFVERYPDLLPVESAERAEDCVKIYNEYANNRNIMLRRTGTWRFPTSESNEAKKTYIWYDENGKPSAYITFDQQQYYCVNRMESIALNVYEMAFTSPKALKVLLGFLRMFEGEDKKIKIHNCAMAPEVETTLKNYMHTTYTIIPDLAARIFDVPAILKLNDYKGQKGRYSVEIVNDLEYTNGIYVVEFDGKNVDVRKNASVTPDIVCPMPAFTQLVYGYNEYDAFGASFLEGTTVNNPESDFFRAFHKKPNGLFEHF